MFLVFAMESKLFPKAAALEGDIAEYLAHALVWALFKTQHFAFKINAVVCFSGIFLTMVIHD